MSCLNANIAIVEKLIKPSLTFVGGGIKASLSAVCSVHNSLNALTDNGKILYDGDKLLLI
jgi:hypothetical protein